MVSEAIKLDRSNETQMTAASNNTSFQKVTGTCGRCDGAGVIRAFGHYVNGTCFACHGTGELTVELSEIDAATRDASIKLYHSQRAWLASLISMTPAQVVSYFDTLSSDKVWAIRNACAGWDVPGARIAYWSASTVLNAWPTTRPYPVSWITAE